MNRIIKTFAIVATLATVYSILAFSQFEEKKEGAIGDVKYSVLPPDKFKEENGSGWVLMDDKIPLPGSALNTKHGITSLPDVRGLFIRSLNLNRNDDKADAFFKENNKQRILGEFEDEEIKLHGHELTFSIGAYRGWAGGWGAGGVPGTNVVLTPGEDILKVKQFGKEETRPKNIALYTYIKIND